MRACFERFRFIDLPVRPGGNPERTVPSAKPVMSGCPVTFGAEVDGRAIAHTVEDAQQNPDAPWLRLTFGPERAILSASVVIHGFRNSGLLLPAGGQFGSTTAEIIQNFELKRMFGQSTVADTEIRVTRLRLVRWAELTEVRFADSSVWHPAPDAHCRAIPSLFHLLSATAQ